MRYLQAIIFVALLVVTLIFAVQNTGMITVSFLNWKLSQPAALFLVVVYILGMLSGWTVLAFVRGSLRQVASRPGR